LKTKGRRKAETQRTPRFDRRRGKFLTHPPLCEVVMKKRRRGAAAGK
jgi:hypothetical protein